MLDDFRESGDFLEDEDPETSAKAIGTAEDELLFGMTPVQRFVLAVLFFLSMCMLGSFCLLITDKIALPLF
ncbi:MAG TPA: hypothetical protein ENJ54_02105 [Chloroflexi bacterium]|nr:hypothetical protein [Chloroflexota bacterium]